MHLNLIMHSVCITVSPVGLRNIDGKTITTFHFIFAVLPKRLRPPIKCIDFCRHCVICYQPHLAYVIVLHKIVSAFFLYQLGVIGLLFVPLGVKFVDQFGDFLIEKKIEERLLYL